MRPMPIVTKLVVVTSPMFPGQCSPRRYSNPASGVVYSVNGKRVRSLQQLVAILRDLKDEFVVIEFTVRGETLVFARKEITSATEAILNDKS